MKIKSIKIKQIELMQLLVISSFRYTVSYETPCHYMEDWREPDKTQIKMHPKFKSIKVMNDAAVI